MIYLTNAVKIPPEYRHLYGFLASSIYNRNTEDELSQGARWILDNDAYAGKFDTRKWLSFLLKNEQYKSTCIAVTIPDVVGDALATLRQFSQYWRVVKDLGYPVGLVTQDGITPEVVPWNNLDAIFVGGTDDHKLYSEAGLMIAEAKSRGKWVHIGRVNSESRIKRFWMADSVDGTQLTIIGQGQNGQSRKDRQADDIERFAKAVEFCRNKKLGLVKASGQMIMYAA